VTSSHSLHRIVWAPAVTIYAIGAGLASIPRVDSPNSYIGLASWLSAVTCIGSSNFPASSPSKTRSPLLLRSYRLLWPPSRCDLASEEVDAARSSAFSLRLRAGEDHFSFACEQEKIISKADLPYPALPAWRHKFSDLSPSFLARIGSSSSTVNLPLPHQVLPFTSDTRSAVSYAHSRASTEEPDDLDRYREFRSPTPGSSRGLLDRSATSTPAYPLSRPATPGDGFEIDETPEVLDENDERTTVKGETRNSFSSFASRASTYLQPGGFLANGAVRSAINNSRVKEAWGSQEPPGTGHSKSVELSQQEMRGALVRIGGHGASCLLAYVRLLSLFIHVSTKPFFFAGTRLSVRLRSHRQPFLRRTSHRLHPPLPRRLSLVGHPRVASVDV
jgi:hypothetical protein